MLKVSKGQPVPVCRAAASSKPRAKSPTRASALPRYPGDFDELTAQPPSSRLIPSQTGSEEAFIGNHIHGRKRNVVFDKKNHNRGQSRAGKAAEPEDPTRAGGSSQSFSCCS